MGHYYTINKTGYPVFRPDLSRYKNSKYPNKLDQNTGHKHKYPKNRVPKMQGTR